MSISMRMRSMRRGKECARCQQASRAVVLRSFVSEQRRAQSGRRKVQLRKRRSDEAARPRTIHTALEAQGSLLESIKVASKSRNQPLLYRETSFGTDKE